MKTTHAPLVPSTLSSLPASHAAASRSAPAPALASNWIPPRWNLELRGLLFLPRMLEKGRRVVAGERHDRNLMNGYLFGRFDYADRGMLKFLRTTETRILDLLRQSEDDAVVARLLLEASGRSEAEIQAWNRRFRTLNALFLAMWDADEGRRDPGLGTSLLKFFYNYGLMPPVYLYFRLAQKLSPSAFDRHN